MSQSNGTEHELAELTARVARLEADLAETRRVNAAWRALHARSERVLHRMTRRLDEALESATTDEAADERRCAGEPSHS